MEEPGAAGNQQPAALDASGATIDETRAVIESGPLPEVVGADAEAIAGFSGEEVVKGTVLCTQLFD